MYNNIGIATPRGSGTSGYIQRNYGHVRSKLKGRDEFLKELKALKENVLPTARKANEDIIKHD